MAGFLNNYIESLTGHQQMRVADLFNVAVLAKIDLSTLTGLLNAQANFGFITFNQMPTQGVLSATDWTLNVRNINMQFQQLFSVANQVGQLLDQNQLLLNSQIAALEKQLSALEKQVANYQFLVSNGGTFNYAYIETFHDGLGEEVPYWPVPDRDGNPFNPTLQGATILADEGAIVLPDNFATNLALNVNLLGSNVGAYVTSDTGISNVLSSNSQTGWRMAAACPTPISASLPDLNFIGTMGAQAIIEVSLGQPQSVNSIKLVPLAGNPLSVVQVVAYGSATDQAGTPLISGNQPVQLTQSTSLHFPTTNVQRIRIYLNQPTYTRDITYTNIGESNYRQLITTPPEADEAFTNFAGTTESFSHLPHYSLASLKTYVPEITPQLLENRTRVGPADFWREFNVYGSSFYSLFSSWPGIYKTIFANSNASATYDPTILGELTSANSTAPNPVTAMPALTTSSVASPMDYEYVLGLQYLGLGIDVPAYKGFFLSTVVASPGDMGEVQMRVQDSDYLSTNATLDNPILTSIEYSVTNTSLPIEELDWTPIFPTNYTTVKSERLVPDKTANCTFRFLANPNEIISVYKNGYHTSSYNINYDTSDNNATGVQLLPGTYTANDIFTAAYTPNGNPSLIDFTQVGFNDVPLVSASDTHGNGEGFLSTGGRNTVQLAEPPYAKISLVNNSGYTPITVVLSDGTTAVNRTNYGGGQSSFPNIDGYYYIQSGNTLIFNQAITQPFRVYYQYLQNNVRFRVVLRSNSVDFISPTVNSVQLKAQIRVPSQQQSV